MGLQLVQDSQRADAVLGDIWKQIDELHHRLKQLESHEAASGLSSCRLVTVANHTLINNFTSVLFSFGAASELWDDDNYHSETVNPSRITIPTDGRYLFMANITIAAASGIYGFLHLAKNGTINYDTGSQTLGVAHVSINDLSLPLLWHEACVAGDYFELYGNAFGGNITVSAGDGYFGVVRTS